MKINDCLISLIVFGALLVSSFMPVGQIILLYWNGGLLLLVENLAGFDGLSPAISFNALFTLVSLSVYFKSQNILWRIFSAIAAAFFINGLTLYGFEKGITDPDSRFHYAKYMVGAVLTGVGLLLANAFRVKTLPASTTITYEQE